MNKTDKNHDLTFAYLSILNKEMSPGVYKKILGTVKGAEKLGYRARIWCEPPAPGFLKRISDMIIHSKEKILFVRSLSQYNFFLIYAFIIARKQGKKIILDVPTPNRVAVHEIANGDQKGFGKFKSLLYLIGFGPIPYWFVSGVIQYSNEGKWFLIGNKSKTKIMGNGIDVNQIPYRKDFPKWPNTQLKLIGVASINYWHGFDRLFKAIADFNFGSKKEYTIFFTLVGGGAALQDLRTLAEKLQIEQYIEFTGPLYGDDLYAKYSSAHLAIGSLALHRKNLSVASELKSREYCAIGIPFLATGKDPDFPENLPFRVELENSDETQNLVTFFQNMDDFYSGINFMEIRKYAELNLDFKAKLKKIIATLT